MTDRSYLFQISDALEAQDAAAALAQLAQLRQQSVDVKRLTEELIAHYRALMLAALPGGQALLSGVSPEEEALYLQKGPEMGQREAIRAIRTLGTALEHMTRGSDQRIELELALFSLSGAAPADAGGNGTGSPCPHGTVGSTPSLCGSGAALCQRPGAARTGSNCTPDPGSRNRTCPCCAGGVPAACRTGSNARPCGRAAAHARGTAGTAERCRPCRGTSLPRRHRRRRSRSRSVSRSSLPLQSLCSLPRQQRNRLPRCRSTLPTRC